MRGLDRVRLVALLLLGLFVVVYAVRVTRHFQRGGALRAEVGRVQLTHIDEATVERLRSLPSKVTVIYYVSSSERMPSDMRRLERGVTDLLDAMKAAAPETFDYQIVDPDTDPTLAGFASRRRVAPFRVRSVAHDSYSERTVWSALTISHGAHDDAVLNGVRPEHLSLLQGAILEHLDQMDEPRRARIALAAPAGFDELRTALAEHGEVEAVDLSGDSAFPWDSDVLFWMHPRDVSPERLDELERYLEAGRSVVVAGGGLLAGSSSLVAHDGRPAISFRADPSDMDALVGRFGLALGRELLLDQRADQLVFEGEALAAPFVIRSIAPNQNFRTWRGQPNGTLTFTAPASLHADTAALAAQGWNVEVLATSSDTSWVQPAPLDATAPLAIEEMRPENGDPVAKQALMLGLLHDDPWRGRLVACGATTPFEDGLLFRERTAHRSLVRTLLNETTSSDRLVMARVDVERAEPLPPLSNAARFSWRAFCVFFLPLVLAAFGVYRGAFGARRRDAGPRDTTRWKRALATPVVGFALVVFLVLVARGMGVELDATSGGWNRLTDGEEAIASRAGEAGEVRAELFFSAKDRMPPAMRALERRTRDVLAALERGGARIETVLRRPSPGDADERAAWADRGIEPTRVTSRDEEVTFVRDVYSSLVLARGTRSEVLHFPDAASLEGLRFRLAFALWRLNTGRAPHIAFASDVPRLSAAESFEQYQQKGLFAPKGADTYRIAREVLSEAGYRVTHVNPRDPVLPDDVDALVWLQPRRSIEAMMEVALRYLHGGGRVLIAAQHFNILSQQYRGAEFQHVYWPQPQSPDVEQIYFPELSVELVREVLFDELMTRLEVDTEIAGRSARRAVERQESALPFLIRTASAHYDDTSPITRNLGDQAFVWGNYLRWDDAKLAALGLRAKPLITTSDETWSYAWTGGWVPHELFDGPAPDVEGGSERLGRVPLAVQLSGTFPRPKAPLRRNPSPTDDAQDEGPPWPASAPGELVLVGCSELFKDARIRGPEFRGDHLLSNAVAALALEPELASVATHRAVPRGFGYVEPDTRLAWRAFVVGGGPLGILALGGCLALLRRRPPSRRRDS